jgi:cysteine desulfurase
MANLTPLFFDYNSTTPVDPAVFEAMAPYFTEQFGNPSSQHSYGWTAAKAVSDARKQVAAVLNCDPKEIIFTSGATESIHLAIMGIALKVPIKDSHFITTSVEHSAVQMTFKNLQAQGASVTFLPVSATGEVSGTELAKAILPNTKLVSVIHANNEIGTINNLDEIAKVCVAKKIPLHVDGAQSFTKVDLDVKRIPIDLMSISAHKIYGPKGVGALFKRSGLTLATVIAGGSQEEGIRPGTINVPGVVGLGAASQLAMKVKSAETLRLRGFQKQILDAFSLNPAIKINGCLENRLCNNLSLTFLNADPDDLMQKITKIAFSQSSACTSGMNSGSRVLSAIGLTTTEGEKTMRIGLGRFTTEAEVATLIEVLKSLA